MSEIFCVPILNAMVHNKETKRILKPYKKQRKQSKFIRENIIRFAISKGYKSIKLGKSYSSEMQKIVPKEIRDKVTKAHMKGYIDYNFAIAFYWLKALAEFEDYNKSKLMREIITQAHRR